MCLPVDAELPLTPYPLPQGERELVFFWGNYIPQLKLGAIHIVETQ